MARSPFRTILPLATALALGCLALPHAQAQTGQQAPPKDKEEEWTELTPEAETPEPEPPPPGAEKPLPSTGSPYLPPATKPTSQPDKPAEPEPDDGGTSEGLAWMSRWQPQFAWRSISAEFDMWSTDEFTSYTWDLVARLGVEDFPAYFDIDIPWTFLDVSGAAGQLQFGNPTLGGHGGGMVADVVGIWAGLTVSIPTTFPDTGDQDGQSDEWAALAAASQVRALVQAHRFMALYVPLRLLTGVEVQIHPYIYLRAEFDPLLAIPTEDAQDQAERFGHDAFFAAMDQIYEVEALSPIGLGGGVRFQAWLQLTNNARLGARTQTAIEPYITYSPPFIGPFAAPVFARAGLLIALDEPLGMGFDDNKVATLRTQVGVRY